MRVSARWFSLHKDGNSPEQCDDACKSGQLCFAVADGASDSFRSGRWARALVSHFVSSPFSPAANQGEGPTLTSWLEPIQKSWSEALEAEWESLPWYVQRKALAGSHSTLLTLEIDGSRWRAAAVGDSCLFHVRDGQKLKAFPLDSPDQFDSSPELVCSQPERNDETEQALRRDEGQGAVGDVFLLATDALACWALGSTRSAPWTTLAGLADQAAFQHLVEELRAQALVRNDDMTLMVIELVADEEPVKGGG